MQATIAHLSDVHLAPLAGLGIGHLNLKRGLGLGNWLYKRRKVHLRPVVDALTADLKRQAVDHIIVSGDLTNLGLPGEHQAALEWLKTIGPPDRVTVVPGNHDIYCPLWRDAGVERWRAYMTSDSAGSGFATPVERGFPFVRIVGQVAIVGVVSAIPTKPFYAIGRMGEAQIKALSDTLAKLERGGYFRLVVIHHPPLPGQADERRGLTDAAELEAMLLQHGAELVIHGHNHMEMLATRSWRTAAGSSGIAHVVGVASASVGRVHHREPLGRYNLMRIETGSGRPRIEVRARGIDVAGGTVSELWTRVLTEDVAEAR